MNERNNMNQQYDIGSRFDVFGDGTMAHTPEHGVAAPRMNGGLHE